MECELNMTLMERSRRKYTRKNFLQKYGSCQCHKGNECPRPNGEACRRRMRRQGIVLSTRQHTEHEPDKRNNEDSGHIGTDMEFDHMATLTRCENEII